MTNRRRTSLASAIFAVVFSVACASSAHASVQISSRPTQNMSCAAGVCTATAQKAVLNASDLSSMLANGDVTVSGGRTAKDIYVTASLSWTSASRLTLDAYRSISFTKVLDVAGSGALTMLTNDGGSGGDLFFSKKGRVIFRGTDNSLIINGHTYGLIHNIGDLRRVGNSFSYVALCGNVDARHKVYTTAPVQHFGVNLEGLGNTISNLQIQDSQTNDLVGLIGTYNWSIENATIRDLNLRAVDIQGSGAGQRIGALAGTSNGHIWHVSVTGEVSSSAPNVMLGGLVGDNSGGFVTQSRANVAVSGGASSAVGGLVGKNVGDCTGACNGIVGQSYSTGAVTGGDNTTVGGLVGENIGGELQDTYAIGAVTGGNNAVVGGLAGSNQDNGSYAPAIARSYSTGAVAAGSSGMIGGLLGQDVAQVNTSHAYWDLDTSGISDPSQGAGNVVNDPGITGLTTFQLQSGLPIGFSRRVWRQSATVNGGLPYLLADPAE